VVSRSHTKTASHAMHGHCLVIVTVVSWATLGAVTAAQQPPQTLPAPLVKENVTVKLSAHTYVIPDGNVVLVPNVGIVVGTRATLVVDTGMGPRNGEAVLREVAKVSKNAQLYLVTTHFHAEHVAGIAAFPPGTKFVISRQQQRDLDELGPDLTKRFAGFSPAIAELLKDAPVRHADVLFDRDYTIELGGVRVRLLALGSTHTPGDTMAFVEQDRVLFAGDVVMVKAPVAFSPTSTVNTWVSVLKQLGPLRPSVIVPAHGLVGDGGAIAQQRTVFEALQARVRELRAQGRTADEAVMTLTAEFQSQHPDWTAPNRVGAIVRSLYAEPA
jgi:glyoxylase-like metal-dependent hydrolase (beta-lactamase superfamily II)